MDENKGCELAPAATLLSRIEALGAGLMQSVAALAQSLRNRHEARRLLYLDDRMLNDMGLKRSDVERAFQSRWNEDPTQSLQISRTRNRATRFWLQHLR